MSINFNDPDHMSNRPKQVKINVNMKDLSGPERRRMKKMLAESHNAKYQAKREMERLSLEHQTEQGEKS